MISPVSWSRSKAFINSPTHTHPDTYTLALQPPIRLHHALPLVLLLIALLLLIVLPLLIDIQHLIKEFPCPAP